MAYGVAAKDFEDKDYIYHEVKKVWKGIVSCGDYTVDKCMKIKKGLVLWYLNEKMSIPYDQLQQKKFTLHGQVIMSKFGKPYRMVDFGWKPDEQSVEAGGERSR